MQIHRQQPVHPAKNPAEKKKGKKEEGACPPRITIYCTERGRGGVRPSTSLPSGCKRLGGEGKHEDILAPHVLKKRRGRR